MNKPAQQLPPMFTRATGDGDPCHYCTYLSRTTTKRVLPDGTQICPRCDSG